jgi:hypothetical protein
MIMKKILLSALLLVSMAAQATTVGDTLVVKHVDKVTIETTDTAQHITLKGADFSSAFRYEQRIAIKEPSDVRRKFSSLKDFNRVKLTKNRKGKENKKGDVDASGHIFLGLETMTGAPSDWEFKLWPSVEFGGAITIDWYPFGAKNVWSIGFGVDWRNYRMSKSTFINKDADGVLFMAPYSYEQTDRRTSLNIFSLQIPVLYTHKFAQDGDWGLTLGTFVNFNTSGYGFRKFSYQGEGYEIERHALGLHQVTLDFFLGFDNPAVPVYFKYSPTTPFKSSRGPKMHQLSFGFWF